MTDVTRPTGAPVVETVEKGRDRILRVAAELFLTRGYAETSLRTIAEAAEMQPASIYHHFDSKDALLTEILDIGITAISDAFDHAADAIADEATERDRLSAHICSHLQSLFANHAFTAAHVTVFPFAPDGVRSDSVPGRDAYEAKWTHLLESIVPDLSPQALTYSRLSLIGAMNSSLHWFDSNNGSLDDLASALTATFWNGMASHS